MNIKVVRLINLILVMTLFISFPTASHSKEEYFKAARTMVDLFGKTFDQIMESKNQEKMAQIQAMMNQRMWQQLSPRPLPLGSSKHFPQCQRPDTNISIPQSACQNINSFQDLSLAHSFSSLSQAHLSFYKAYLTPSNLHGPTHGIQCLEDAAKRLNSDLQEKRNQLQNLITQVKKINSYFQNTPKSSNDK